MKITKDSRGIITLFPYSWPNGPIKTVNKNTGEIKWEPIDDEDYFDVTLYFPKEFIPSCDEIYEFEELLEKHGGDKYKSIKYKDWEDFEHVNNN